MRVCIPPLCLFIYFPFFWMYCTAQIQKIFTPTNMCVFYSNIKSITFSVKVRAWCV